MMTFVSQNESFLKIITMQSNTQEKQKMLIYALSINGIDL